MGESLWAAGCCCCMCGCSVAAAVTQRPQPGSRPKHLQSWQQQQQRQRRQQCECWRPTAAAPGSQRPAPAAQSSPLAAAGHLLLAVAGLQQTKWPQQGYLLLPRRLPGWRASAVPETLRPSSSVNQLQLHVTMASSQGWAAPAAAALLQCTTHCAQAGRLDPGGSSLTDDGDHRA